jgi:hypothetical protein
LTLALMRASVWGAMRRLALALAVLVLSGCGSIPAPPQAASPQEEFWAKQAIVLLDGLDDALGRISAAGVGPSTLTNSSLLYSALIGYTYIETCGEQLAHLGQPSKRELTASTRLHRACPHLRHATALFRRAVAEKRAAPLVAAAGEALETIPLLRQARVTLAPIAGN